MATDNNSNNNFEAALFKTADKLRKNIDAAEYKNVVLGLIFLEYISDSFQELYERLEQDEYSDPEDRDEYIAENCFFVPEQARWKSLQAKAKLPEIGVAIDDAMAAIEKENAELKHVLPKVYAKPNLDKASLGQLIDVISDIELKAAPRPPEGGENRQLCEEGGKQKSPSGDLGAASDLLGRVYEYFLGEFANAEGKKGGQFYTPKSIVKLMVEMIEPYKGRVYDPACGSGGMFVMSEKFVQEHQGNIQDITIYGQESNQTTWKLSKMNLAIRNINSQFVAWNTEGTFLKDMNPDLKADFILANPPFNQSEWGQDILQEDGRWKYGVPPAGNANFAWMQHMLYHLAPNGVMATVLANGSLSSNTSGEGEIRKNIVQADLVDCIVALPKQLFYNTGIPATIWILRRSPRPLKGRGETLFIDASEMGFMKDRVHREFTLDDIKTIEQTYHSWREAPKSPEGDLTLSLPSEGQVISPPSGGRGAAYEDIKGFCKSATLADIEKHSFVLTPGRYVGIPDEEDDGIPFEDKMKDLTTTLAAQMQKEKELDEQIKIQLAKIGFEL